MKSCTTISTLGNSGIRVKGNEKHEVQPSTQSSRWKLNFIVIVLKIATKQRETFTSNQDFQWKLVNSKYILQKIVSISV